jgi:enolase
MTRIERIRAREVLDSRGRPTVEAEVILGDGTIAAASAPAGASTGRHEMHELRDDDTHRYGGRGVRGAIANVAGEISSALAGLNPHDQGVIDRTLIELDGTPDKSRLGANALTAVSLATARAAAVSAGLPLWRYLGGEDACLLPMPMVNILSGGLHARGGLDFQDFLIVPLGAATYTQALEMSVGVRDRAAEVLSEHGLSTLKADEGGFGPSLARGAAALELLVEAVERAGYVPGDEVAFALDVAATQFHDADAGVYRLAGEDSVLGAAGLVDLLEQLVERFPVVSIEDPLAEDDWHGWQQVSTRLGAAVQLIGDDLFTTNPARLRRGIEQGIANAVLVKLNQIGTLTEMLAVITLAQEAGYRVVVSARSGETEDPALADLAVASGAGQIKIGSVAQSERLAKYNQLLRIEDALGERARFAGRLALARSPTRATR